MRLQLTARGRASSAVALAARAACTLAASAVLALAAAPARAQVGGDGEQATATAGVRVYADDDRVTVWSPSARAATPLPRGLAVEVTTTIDAVTAASVDVVATASPYAFTETRVEGGIAVGLAVAPYQQAAVRAIVSDERDFTALRLGGGWRAELAERNTTLELTAMVGLDTVGRAGDPGFARDRRELRLGAALTQITDRRGYVDAVLEAVAQRGYLASPYRFVPVELGAAVYHLPERVPDERAALAALARGRRAVGARTFVHLDYRLGRDTWAITSHTATARAARSLRADEVVVGLEARGYVQGAASFHRARYLDDGGAPAWRTRDRTLGRMVSATTAALVEARLPWAELRASASAAWVRFWWRDDPLQARRDAVVASLSLLVPLRSP